MDLAVIAGQILGVTSDSRLVKPGFVFVAIKGEKFNGHEFINQALSLGAKFVLYDQDVDIKNQEKLIRVKNSRQALTMLASLFCKDQPENIVAITGTNGKSSIVSFYQQIIELSGYKAGSIGTIGVKGFSADCSLTTPDPVTLYTILSQAKAQGVEYLGLEASSHGLNQHRLDGLRLKAAGFSNFTQDHLDYHRTLEDYFAAKMYLFTDILKNGIAVINADIPEYHEIKNICLEHNHQVFDYGKKGNFIRLLNANNYSNGMEFSYELNKKVYSSKVKLVGSFQLYNILSAIGFAYAVGIDENQINKAISLLKCVEGRMDRANVEDKEIYIDYAHTPDALEKALKSLRPYVQKRLLVVFGCGGDRDTSKRALMGKVAQENADLIIVTDDNPRTENPKTIRRQILEGCPNAIESENREEAINYAINQMSAGDVLLIAGKGHEDYQIIGTEKFRFSDKEVVEKICNKVS